MIRNRKSKIPEINQESEYESESDQSKEYSTEEEQSATDTHKDHLSETDEKIQNVDVPSSNKTIRLNYCYILSAAIFLLVTAAFMQVSSTVSGADHNKDEKLTGMLLELMQIMKTNFNNQQLNIWDEIESGITDLITNREKISIFVLLGNEQHTINCLATSLGRMSNKILQTNEYVTLNPMNQGHDTGKVLVDLRNQMLQRRIMIVEDFLNINIPTLLAFHYLCDRENPSVRRAIYIITVMDSKYKGSQNAVHYIQEAINTKLSGTIVEDSIEPLITRITSGSVLYIQQEQTMRNC